jgi:hypothetical protein
VLRSFILKDASAKHVDVWLDAWARQSGLLGSQTVVGYFHGPLGGDWGVEAQVLPLSANRCELHIWWSDSENTRNQAAKYLERIATAISKRWTVEEQFDAPHAAGMSGLRPKVSRQPYPRTQQRNREKMLSILVEQQVNADGLSLEVVRAVFGLSEQAAASRKISDAGFEGINGLADALEARLSQQEARKEVDRVRPIVVNKSAKPAKKVVK